MQIQRPTPDVVWAALDDARDEALLVGRPLVVVHGACPTGADAHARDWCATADQSSAITEESHPADWAQHGRAAGPIRNRLMVNAGADVCLAFIRNGSRGATGCVRLAEAAGIPVRRWTT